MISGVWTILLDATAKPSHSIYLISYLSINLLRTSHKGLALGRIGRSEGVACGTITATTNHKSSQVFSYFSSL